ncbi:MAG: hypothetical protein LLF80_06105 [Porphyromonadaceae bacterium]|nr:hypothetical protein [Porphyromonadaceae bacterium]
MDKANDLTEKEKFCLDAFIVNGNDDLAYTLSRERKPNATEDNIHRLALRWLRSDPVKAYLKERRAMIYSRTEKVPEMEKDAVKELVDSYRDKDFIIAELIKTQQGLSGKEKADIINRIADLQQMKKEENKSEEERVHFYLPLPVCDNCQFKGNLVGNRQKEV